MSIGAHLIHRCTVQRASKQENPYGEDVVAYKDWLVGEPCRLVVSEERILDTALAQGPTVTRYEMFFAPGRDVMAEDQIVDLVYEDGAKAAETFSVESAMPRRGRVVRHITCELKRVS